MKVFINNYIGRFFYLAILFLIFSCKKKESQETLQLTLLNDEIYYQKRDSTSHYITPLYYNSLKNLIKAKNVINYKISNSTDFDYLLLLEPDRFEYGGDINFPAAGNYINYSITKDDILMGSGGLTDNTLDTNKDFLKTLDLQRKKKF